VPAPIDPAQTPNPAETLPDVVRRYAEAAIEEKELDAFVVDVEVRGHQGSRVVTVYIDAEKGLGVDEAAVVSRCLGFHLENDDVIKGAYRLEVSSPGAKRPLQDPRQYPQHVGRTLRVRYTPPGGGTGQELATVKGELQGADAERFVLALPSGETAEIAYDAVDEAKIVLPW
jgi:ribosome maturation factor RimP